MDPFSFRRNQQGNFYAKILPLSRFAEHLRKININENFLKLFWQPRDFFRCAWLCTGLYLREK
jgi:hypothetical protein